MKYALFTRYVIFVRAQCKWWDRNYNRTVTLPRIFPWYCQSENIHNRVCILSQSYRMSQKEWRYLSQFYYDFFNISEENIIIFDEERPTSTQWSGHVDVLLLVHRRFSSFWKIYPSFCALYVSRNDKFMRGFQPLLHGRLLVCSWGPLLS
jgi:hypothetical protein